MKAFFVGQSAIAWRYGLANLLLVLAIAAQVFGSWALLIVTIPTLMLGPVDDAAGDDDATANKTGRWFYTVNLFATAPLLAILTIAILHDIGRPDWTGIPMLPGGGFLLIAIAFGYLHALMGATVAHELTHWTDNKPAQLSAQVLLAFMFNTAFMIYHVHGHHRHVGLYRDAATARRGESAVAFILRTTIQQFVEAWRFEAERLRRDHRTAWSLRNRVLAGQVLSLSFVAIAGLVGGPRGALFFLLSAVIGRVFHELMNYVQHYGLVRVEGERLQDRHTWDCYRVISNALHYNLPRHSQHHLFASRPYWELEGNRGAPVLPYGYQTMAALAIVPGVWRRTMRPVLADWDRRFASEGERQVIHERGWDAV